MDRCKCIHAADALTAHHLRPLPDEIFKVKKDEGKEFAIRSKPLHTCAFVANHTEHAQHSDHRSLSRSHFRCDRISLIQHGV